MQKRKSAHFKTFGVILIIFSLFITSASTAFASGTNVISASSVSTQSGETISIPVNISGNEGIMGFSVIVSYDENTFSPVSVSQGSLLASGTLNDSIETSTTNSFKIIWTGVSEISNDGELFVLRFDVAESASGSYTLGLSYEAQDTFNENWEDVSFDCKGISVTVGNNNNLTTTPSEHEDPQAPETPGILERFNNKLSTLPAALKLLATVFVKPIVLLIALFE